MINARVNRIMIGVLMKTFISGFLCPFFSSFAPLLISRIKTPVIPVEITPAIPRIEENPNKLNFWIMMYRISGIKEVNMNVFLFEKLRSKRQLSLRENESTK